MRFQSSEGINLRGTPVRKARAWIVTLGALLVMAPASRSEASEIHFSKEEVRIISAVGGAGLLGVAGGLALLSPRGRLSAGAGLAWHEELGAAWGGETSARWGPLGLDAAFNWVDVEIETKLDPAPPEPGVIPFEYDWERLTIASFALLPTVGGEIGQGFDLRLGAGPGYVVGYQSPTDFSVAVRPVLEFRQGSLLTSLVVEHHVIFSNTLAHLVTASGGVYPLHVPFNVGLRVFVDYATRRSDRDPSTWHVGARIEVGHDWGIVSAPKG